MTWQTIETAPRDGTEILASDPDVVEIISWCKGRFDAGIPGEWINRYGDTFFPDWWQPLPDHLDMPVDKGATDEQQPPADGEVGELRALVTRMADELDYYRQLLMDDRREVHALANEARAALARWGTAPPRPIPVAERLPEPGDCDAQGRCWLLSKVGAEWRLINATNPEVPHPKYFYCFSHWLPAQALPLPTKEATP